MWEGKGALGKLFAGLLNGDPMAWLFVSIFVALLVGFGIAMVVVKRKLKREDDERAKRYGRK